jgi:hypothetical protein
MDNVVRFTSKSELERERLIREARAIYDSIFPPADPAGEHADGRPDPTTTGPALNPSSAHRRSDTR